MGKKKLDQIAYEHIVQKIENGILLQREHIKEQDVADELQISRTPVRTAFIRLVEDEYLEYIKKNGGVRVKTRNLDSRGFQERLDLFERLMNHYLFDLEKGENDFDSAKMPMLLEDLKQNLSTKKFQFEKIEYKYWTSVLKYNQNAYERNMLLKTLGECLFDKGYIQGILKNSRDLKVKHLNKLTAFLEENDYPAARREIRILLNQLKLNVVEHGMKY